IKYNFSGSTKSVTIRIFDFGMNLVKTVIQNVNREGEREYIDNWNGRDENNSIVPNGVYFYRIDVGNDDPLYGKIMVLM
ncbi:MAG: FlgD immunoglobulin-like domain containing protein, partial [Melioribacteraceae bacterium]|nr:FlgD immunoglobulin-like domain containing protein [Melioribacteraceae bacterium]